MIIGKNTMLPVNFLEKATACSKAVGRIVTTYPYSSMGTGFIISGEFLVTCNHIIPDIIVTENSTFQIDYYIKSDGTFSQYHELKLNASKFFATSKELDLTIVAIKTIEGINLKERCLTNLQLSNLMIGESANIIHHALGEPLKISIRSSEIVEFSNRLVHYDSPTSRGSAGAPVFNDQWELIGIHHSGGFLKSIDHSSLQVWLNEGIRISAFMDWYNIVTKESSQNQILNTHVTSGKITNIEQDILASFAERIEKEEEGKRDSVFISYAHKDQEKVEWQVELEKYIKNVSIIGSTRVWYDDRIKAGTEWKVEIESALKKTKVAVLLVGPNFLNSEFILNSELPNLLEAAKNDGVRIIPLITHRVPYKRSVLSKFQSFNSPENPLQEQRKNDAIKTLNQVVEEIAKEYDVK